MTVQSGRSLADRIAAQIRMDGPIPVSVYMQLALHDRTQGYYATRPGLGRDFATAPEITQVFGELIGLWTRAAWDDIGRPDAFDLIEIGPGRGVLMADALRAMRSQPDCLAAMSLTLVEPSPALRAVQAQNLSAANPAWTDALDDGKGGADSARPAVILANEWLDCLPVRQFVRDQSGWRERVVGLDAEGRLAFGVTRDPVTPPGDPPASAGAYEYPVGLETAIDMIASRLKEMAGRALLIDYGPDDGPPGDTLRAYSKGRQTDPLAAPGEADVTADVDFSALAGHARRCGLDLAGPTPQGLFLKRFGAEARVSALMSANPGKADAVAADAMRVMSPDEMGLRFKAVCLSSPGLPPPAGF